MHTDEDRGFFREVQGVYERVAPEIADPSSTLLPRPEEVPAPEADRIKATCLYGTVAVRRYPFEVEYDGEGYFRLLGTYSGHSGLAADIRDNLLLSIAGLIELIDGKYGGHITEGYLATLYVARRN